MIVGDSEPVPLTARNLFQLGAFGKLWKLTLYSLHKLLAAVLSRLRLNKALQDLHSKALLVQGMGKNSPWSKFYSYACPYLVVI